MREPDGKHLEAADVRRHENDGTIPAHGAADERFGLFGRFDALDDVGRGPIPNPEAFHRLATRIASDFGKSAGSSYPACRRFSRVRLRYPGEHQKVSSPMPAPNVCNTRNGRRATSFRSTCIRLTSRDDEMVQTDDFTPALFVRETASYVGVYASTRIFPRNERRFTRAMKAPGPTPRAKSGAFPSGTTKREAVISVNRRVNKTTCGANTNSAKASDRT